MEVRKIAFCFSGQVRDFDAAWHSFNRHILRPLSGHQLSFFAHYPQEEAAQRLRSVCFDAVLAEESEPDFSELESIQHSIVDRPWRPRSTAVTAYLRQLRGQYLANDLAQRFAAEHGFRFDIVFRLRFDNLYLTTLRLPARLDRSTVYLPSHDNWGGYNDRFAFGVPEVMNTYSNRLAEAVEYMREGQDLHPESFLKRHLDSHSLRVERTTVVHHLLRYQNLWWASFQPDQGDVVGPGNLFIRAWLACQQAVRNRIGEQRFDRLALKWWCR